MAKINVAAVQTKNNFDIKENVRIISNFIKTIKGKHNEVNLIVFPELALSGYGDFENIDKRAEDIDNSKNISAICKVAKQNEVSVILGYIKKDGNNYYNSLCFIDTNGKIKDNYDKIHLVNEEKDYFKAGNKYKVIDAGFAKIGLMICWDSAFLHQAREYALFDCDLICVSAAWENPYRLQWEIAARARAFDNGINLVACNMRGRSKKYEFCGYSMMINSLGEIKKSCLDKENDYIYYSFDKNEMKENREKFASQIYELKDDVIDILYKINC